MSFYPYALFDMDGTLLDSMQYWSQIAVEALSSVGVNPTPELMQAIQTMSVAKAIVYVKNMHLGEAVDAMTAADVYALMGAHYLNGDVTVRPGVIDLLDRMKREGSRMAIATTTPRVLTLPALEKHGLSGYFEFVLTADEYPHAKKTPDMFFGAAARFGCHAEEMVIFEDTLRSVETAKSIGMKTVVTEDPWQSAVKEELFALADEYYTDGFLTKVK